MEYIVLGLLLLSGRTIYQLRERIDKGLNLMYSSSMGSIQAAVKKLLKNGYIRFEQTTENGRYKKVYHITESGRKYFLEWADSPMSVAASKNPELAKLYFMGFSEGEKREEILENYITQLKEAYTVLEIICDEAKHAHIPHGFEKIAFFQLASAQYGRDVMKFNIQWYEKLLYEIRSKGYGTK